jgi:type IV secretory pathway VirB10-like protein
LGNFVGVSAVVLLSGISGAVVAFNLIGGDARVVPTPVATAAVAPARVDVAQAPIQAPVKLPTKLPTKMATQPIAAPSIPPVVAAAADKQKPAQRAEAPAVAAPVTVAPPQAAPAQLSKTDDAAISSGDLTFAKGYALRRAARQAAAAQAQKSAAAPNAKVAAAAEQPGAAAERQFGRPAVAKRKPSVVAQYPRGDRYSFERFDGPTRHQALAYGDSSRPVRRVNQGGWFDGLF